MEKYIEELLILSKKAYKYDEVPVGALIVYNNKILAKAYNKRNRTNNITNHAEILAIRKAAKKLGDWRLNDCDLYVTLEPCSMCKEVIKQSRIKNVYYLVDKYDYKKEYDKTKFMKISDTENNNIKKLYEKLLSDFFKLKCKR